MTDTHKGIFKGQIKKVRYVVWFGWGGEPSIEKEYDVEWKTISECEFDRPPLEVGEYIHLHQLDEIATVTKSIRSTDNSYLYKTDYVVEEIEDEETSKSKQLANIKLQKILKERQTENENNKKKWYQFWK